MCPDCSTVTQYAKDPATGLLVAQVCQVCVKVYDDDSDDIPDKDATDVFVPDPPGGSD